MARRPDPVLLADGDLLVPVKRGDGRWEMTRYGIEDEHYAMWLGEMQYAAVSVVSRGIWRFVGQYLVIVAFLAVIGGIAVAIIVT